MQKIVPFLWFNGNAEEAMTFYVSIFKNSRVVRVSRYGDAGPGPKGSVMSCTFQLAGQDFYALNGGPQYTFTPAISLFVNCETQQEVDELWRKLSACRKLPPQLVHFLLRLAVHEQRDRRRERVLGAAVQGVEVLSLERERAGHDRALGPRPRVAVPRHAPDLRVLEDRHVEIHRLFGVAVEPQERRDLLHGYLRSDVNRSASRS